MTKRNTKIKHSY